MPLKELFGRRIQEIRKQRKLSQEQVAEKAGISSNYLSRIEYGKENPTFDMLVKLSDALTAEMREIFDFGHAASKKELKEALQNFSQNADEDTLRTIVKIIKIFDSAKSQIPLVLSEALIILTLIPEQTGPIILQHLSAFRTEEFPGIKKECLFVIIYGNHNFSCLTN